ncbi:[acyl-carrier-protein] S-malonyltransferase [Lewinella marina]|uniref:Malonyl CoA-acyl carrier protein transacylase n=1 Tax=Neolewinella marina TaxID=438751 RepID=A0A2G0CHX3_9BACT|nr:ACP S-malonyltransferase [Neolewinella marina]NJB85315.1 [acyl-carrier-protein] S-malonyltransferase [Neolewinella marina]PHK99569.1 [acyl-carrier-protein] S-malonyltransferase [Neolewinella marina]
MTAYVFPGQGAQFTGMGKDSFDLSELAKSLYKQADDVLGYSLSRVMFEGSEEELRQTKITQPAIFVHSTIAYLTAEEEPQPDAVAGHSLGEFSALVAAGAMAFPDALRLVSKRAEAMQEAADGQAGTMAAVLGLSDDVIEDVCAELKEVVVPANYNSPGQLVISGTEEGVAKASKILTDLGARRVVPLVVGGAFHSPLMEPAREALREAIEQTHIRPPGCEVYQNVDGRPSLAPEEIKRKLIDQLTAPVRWTQTIQAMQAAGIQQFVEVGGKGKVLAGLIKKVDRSLQVDQLG